MGKVEAVAVGEIDTFGFCPFVLPHGSVLCVRPAKGSLAKDHCALYVRRQREFTGQVLFEGCCLKLLARRDGFEF